MTVKAKKQLDVNVYYGDRSHQYTGDAADNETAHVYLSYDVELTIADRDSQNRFPMTIDVTSLARVVPDSQRPGKTPVSTPSVKGGVGMFTGTWSGYSLWIAHDIFPSIYDGSNKTITVDVNADLKLFEGWMYKIADGSSDYYTTSQDVMNAMARAVTGNAGTSLDQAIAAFTARGSETGTLGVIAAGSSIRKMVYLEFSDFDPITGEYIGPPILAVGNHFTASANDKWLTSNIRSYKNLYPSLVPASSNDSATLKDPNKQISTYAIEPDNEIIIVSPFEMQFSELMRYRPGAILKGSSWMSHDRESGMSMILKSSGWQVIENTYNPVRPDDNRGIIRATGQWDSMVRIGEDD